MKKFENRKVLALVLAASLVLIPLRAQAGVGDIITFLTTITNTLKDGVGQALNGIESIHTRIRDFQQRVLWPLTLIDQTKRLIGQMRGQLGGLAGQIHSIETNSATLIDPAQLESLLSSRKAGAINQVQLTFNRLYNTIPGANDAAEPDRYVMDTGNAMAVGSLKTAIVSDQASEQLLKVADGLEPPEFRVRDAHAELRFEHDSQFQHGERVQTQVAFEFLAGLERAGDLREFCEAREKTLGMVLVR